MGAFDVKQTSLAVSNLSQIGDLIEVAEVGDVWTKPNGEVWLRSGVAASPALYPALLSFPGYLANGLPSLLPANNAVSNMAANGAGAAILAMGTYDSTNVYYTSNWGATWTTVAHNLGMACTDVIWTGARFICVGNNGANIVISYSATGAAFTLGGNIACTGTANTAKICWDSVGGIALACAAASTAACTTSDGVTLVSKTLSSTINNPMIAVVPSLGASRWLIVPSFGAAAIQSTAADASAWTSVTLPVNASSLAAGGGMFAFGATGAIYRSTTGATGSWSVSYLPLFGNAALKPDNQRMIQWDSVNSLFLIGSLGSSTGAAQFAYSSDLVTFTRRQISAPVGTISNYIAPFPDGAGGIIFTTVFNTSQQAAYTRAYKSTCDYVGLIPATSTQVANSNLLVQGGRATMFYVRAK